MKKTLIALMALAGVAMAETFTMDQLVSTGTLGTGVTLDSSYTDAVYNFDTKGAILNMSNAELTSALNASTGFITIACWVNQTNGDEDAIFAIGGRNDGFKFALKNDNLQITTKGVKDSTTSMSVAQGTLENPAWTLVAVSIDLDKTGSDSVFFVGADGYTTLTMSNGVALGNWNAASNSYFAIGSGNSNGDRDLFEGQIANLTIFTSDTVATAETIMAVMGNTAPAASPIVPEPATATLSLLALAGLAARRRRK